MLPVRWGFAACRCRGIKNRGWFDSQPTPTDTHWTARALMCRAELHGAGISRERWRYGACCDANPRHDLGAWRALCPVRAAGLYDAYRLREGRSSGWSSAAAIIASMVSRAKVHNSGVAGNQPLFAALDDLSERAPALARSILHQTSAPRKALRATNRHLRQALNRTVETVSLVLPGPLKNATLHTTADLGIIFPNATKLRLLLHEEPSRVVVASLLSHLAEGSPRLVSRLQNIVLSINDGHVQALCLTALSTLLSR
jgi:hypothetical protein